MAYCCMEEKSCPAHYPHKSIMRLFFVLRSIIELLVCKSGRKLSNSHLVLITLQISTLLCQTLGNSGEINAFFISCHFMEKWLSQIPVFWFATVFEKFCLLISMMTSCWGKNKKTIQVTAIRSIFGERFLPQPFCIAIF